MDIYVADPPRDHYTGSRRGLQTAAIMSLLMDMMGAPPPLDRWRPTPKKQAKCLLPGCDVMTEHRGGYCCAGHCKEHQNRRGLK